MSENKRFTYENHKVKDNLTGEMHSSNRVSVNVLNAQHEEIQQSKVLIKKYYNENSDLIKENEQLKQQLKSKERLIGAYEQFINDLKEDGVLDD